MKKRIYKERRIYFFTCSNCGFTRQSYKRAKANKAICRNCKFGKTVNKDQVPMFGVDLAKGVSVGFVTKIKRGGEKE